MVSSLWWHCALWNSTSPYLIYPVFCPGEWSDFRSGLCLIILIVLLLSILLGAVSIAFNSQLKPALLKGAPRLICPPKLISHKSESQSLERGSGVLGGGGLEQDKEMSGNAQEERDINNEGWVNWEICPFSSACWWSPIVLSFGDVARQRRCQHWSEDGGRMGGRRERLTEEKSDGCHVQAPPDGGIKPAD